MTLLTSAETALAKVATLLADPGVQAAIKDVEEGAEEALTGLYGAAVAKFIAAVGAIETLVADSTAAGTEAAAGTADNGAAADAGQATS